MADPVIKLVPIAQLSLPSMDPTPTVDLVPIQDVPPGRSLPAIPAMLPASPRIVSYGPEPSATVDIVDRAPVPSFAAPAPWWKDPMKLGLAVAGFLVVLAVLKER